MTVQWPVPSHEDIQGQLRKFLVQIENLLIDAEPGEPDYVTRTMELASDVHTLSLNLTEYGHQPGQPFAYNVRVIPLSRAGSPLESTLASTERFGMLIFASWFEIGVGGECSSGGVVDTITALSFTQLANGNTSVEAKWYLASTKNSKQNKEQQKRSILFRIVRPWELEPQNKLAVIKMPLLDGHSATTLSFDGLQVVSGNTPCYPDTLFNNNN
jgi:hypothetical protein